MGWVETANINFMLTVLENTVIILCTWYFAGHIEVGAKPKTVVRITAFFLYGAGQILFGLYLTDESYGGLGTLAFMIVATLAIGHYLYNDSKLYLFYYFLFPVSIFITQTLISYTAFSYNIARWGLIAFDYYNDNTALIARILSILLLTGVWVLMLNRKKYENVTGLKFAGLFLPPLFSLFIIVSLIILGNIYVQMYGAFLIVVNISLLVLMNLYILYLFSYLSRNRKLKDELEILNRQEEMQYSYYEKLERKYQSSRQLIHDMRNHLQAMEALVQEGEDHAAKGYADDMYQMLGALGRVQYSGNKMLNIILNDKMEQAKAHQIRMVIEVGDIPLDHMKDIDITTVFANLLDNAIEAAGQAAPDKYIKVRAGMFHEFAVIRIENSMPSQTKEKHEKKNHMGIGLENVRRALQKYDGGIQAETDGKEYKVSVTIPIENQKENEEGCGKHEKEH